MTFPFPFIAVMSAASVAITVPAGKVASNLTAFPLYIALADMPPRFWEETSSDGGNIRVVDASGTPIPFDLASFEPVYRRGALFVRVDLSAASATTIKITFAGDGVLSPTAPLGRNAVWQDYEAVTLLGLDPKDRTGKNELRSGGDPQFAKDTVVHTFSQDPHQGGTFDGTYHYIIDTNRIYKFDRAWNLIATNSNPIGDSGLPVVNHLGDPCNKDGKLYIPLEYYSSGSHSNQHIAVYNCSDLSFDTAHSVASVGKEVSSICYCPVDALFYVTDYVTNTIQKYDASFIHMGALVPQYTINQMQGIEWFQGAFWITNDNQDEVMRVEYDGTTTRQVANNDPQGLFGRPVTGSFEGIWAVDDSLHVLSDPSSGNSFVTKWEQFDNPLSAMGGYTCTGTQPSQIACAELTSWTAGATGRVANKTINRCLVSYRDHIGGSGADDRASLLFTSTQSPNTVAVWDDLNGYLLPTVRFNPATNEFFRAHMRYNGTAGRSLSINGAVAATSGAILSKTGLSALALGFEDDDGNEFWNGDIGFAYLRSGWLSDEWIAAEYANLNDPGSFYETS